MSTLVVENVTKTFGGLVAVDSASMTAREGVITALIGPNGAGKTTLFNVITGFEDLDSGTITFEEHRIEGLPPWKVARLGMVRTFQTPIGFPTLSVWENVMAGGSQPRSESIWAACVGRRLWGREQLDVHDRAQQVLDELGLWGRRDVVLADLSAGEIKLVEFARQLMARPRILLLDEPASGVDPGQIGRLGELIKRFNADGITIVVIDHNLSFILSVADYVYVLSDGAVISEGTPEEIARDPNVIEIYLGSRHGQTENGQSENGA